MRHFLSFQANHHSSVYASPAPVIFQGLRTFPLPRRSAPLRFVAVSSFVRYTFERAYVTGQVNRYDTHCTRFAEASIELSEPWKLK